MLLCLDLRGCDINNKSLGYSLAEMVEALMGK